MVVVAAFFFAPNLLMDITSAIGDTITETIQFSQRSIFCDQIGMILVV